MPLRAGRTLSLALPLTLFATALTPAPVAPARAYATRAYGTPAQSTSGSSTPAQSTPAQSTPAQSTPPTPAQSTLPVTVTINRSDPGPPVPQRFLGLSFEMAALPQLARYAGQGDLVKLLRSLGPGVLRFGGITADQNVGWTDPSTPKPAWASSTIDAAELRAIGTLARRSGWQVLLTVGMAHYEPGAAAREVAAAHSALGPYLAAVEIGNEPDAYGRHGFRELPWLAQGYEEEVGDYRAAIQAITPGVPLAGPDVSGSGAFLEWGEEEAFSQQPALLTGHHYPLGCAQTPPPSIEALLSTATRGRESQSLDTYMTIARAHRLPLRIDETNTVSCGGVPGISDTFASALWATGYIVQAMDAGTAGVNLQGNPTNCNGYTPLCAPDPAALARGALRAQPEWYALLLSRSLVGERPEPTTIAAESPPGAESPSAAHPAPASESPSGATGPLGTGPLGTGSLGTEHALNLIAASFAGADHSLRVVLVDDEPPGASPLALRLNVGAGLGPGQILRLTGPRPSASGDILLGGHAVVADGSLRAPIHPERVADRTGVIELALAPSSAALVTVSPRAPRPPHVPRPTRAHHPRGG